MRKKKFVDSKELQYYIGFNPWHSLAPTLDKDPNWSPNNQSQFPRLSMSKFKSTQTKCFVNDLSIHIEHAKKTKFHCSTNKSNCHPNHIGKVENIPTIQNNKKKGAQRTEMPKVNHYKNAVLIIINRSFELNVIRSRWHTKKPCWSGKAATHLVWYFRGEVILLNSACWHWIMIRLVNWKQNRKDMKMRILKLNLHMKLHGISSICSSSLLCKYIYFQITTQLQNKHTLNS